MTYREEVVTLHQRFPTWTSGQIADFLGCRPETVREIGRKERLTFTPKTALSAKRKFKKVRYAGWAGEGRGW